MSTKDYYVHTMVESRSEKMKRRENKTGDKTGDAAVAGCDLIQDTECGWSEGPRCLSACSKQESRVSPNTCFLLRLGLNLIASDVSS